MAASAACEAALQSFPGFSWQNLSLSRSPAPRQDASLAFDPQLGGVVLFGGIGTNGKFLSDTWLFNGKWAELNESSAPSPRAGAVLAYDPALNELLLFGGKNAVGPFGDTWVMGASDLWQNITQNLSTAPSARVFAMMTYDAVDQELVLFGGRTPNSVDGDTWTFSSVGWAPVSAATAPAARYGAGFAYDAADHYALLFGGYALKSQQTYAFNDTWVFSGGTWRNLSLAEAPSPRGEMGLGFDSSQSALILFGGANAAGTSFGDTWAFTGGTWSNITSALPNAPTPRSGLAEAGSNTTGGAGANVVVFGGLEARGSGSPGATLADTWVGGSLPLNAQSVQVVPRHADVGQPVEFSVVAYGGQLPYRYNWTDLPANCASVDASNVTCVAPNSTGQQLVSVEVTGANGSGSIISQGTFQVEQDPSVKSFTVSPTSVSAGEGNVSFVVKMEYGTTPYSYNYSGLPTGCGNHPLQVLICRPITAGSFTVEVNVTDAAGVSVYANATLLVLSPSSGGGGILSKLRSPLGIAAIVIGLVLLALIAFVLVRRRQSPPKGPPTAWKSPSTGTTATRSGPPPSPAPTGPPTPQGDGP